MRFASFIILVNLLAIISILRLVLVFILSGVVVEEIMAGIIDGDVVDDVAGRAGRADVAESQWLLIR